MKTPTQEIHTLLKQIKDYGLQISRLTALQEAAAARVSHHLEELNPGSNCLIQIRQTQEAETKRSPLYIWDNIGEGG